MSSWIPDLKLDMMLEEAQFRVHHANLGRAVMPNEMCVDSRVMVAILDELQTHRVLEAARIQREEGAK